MENRPDIIIHRIQSKSQTATLQSVSEQQISTALSLDHIREDTMLLRRQLEETPGRWPSPLSRVSVTASMEIQEFDDKSCTDAIMSSLNINHIHQREKAIPKTYEKTFEWMFSESQSSDSRFPLFSRFDSWLEGPSSDVYWVTGKAGSGKSTTMKFLLQHPLTREKVTIWSRATDRQLLWGSFFFWNAGSPIQKSKEGLLRALISQFIEQAPEISQQICPRRWALCKTLGPWSVTRAPE